MRKALFLAFLTFFPRPSAAEDIIPATSFVLDNGLEVIAIENRRAPVVTHMLWYKVGGTDDPSGKSGLAHVLEHMMFKGTKKIPDGEFSEIVSRNGGEENAFTGLDYTAYYQNIARDRLETVMFLEADRMKNLRLTEQDFIPELEVVKEERLMRYDNRPIMLLQERKNKALWGDHPYSRPVIGSRGELNALTLNDVKRFYEEHYAPDNAILIVAGDISAEELRPLAEKYYGGIPPRRAVADKRMPQLPYPVGVRLEMTHPQVKVYTFAKEYIVPSYMSDGGKKAPAYAVLAEMLGATHVGALYKRFVVRDETARAANAYYDGFAPGMTTFVVSAVTGDADSAEKQEKGIDAFLSSFAVKEKETEKAKARLVAGLEYVNDNPETAANLVGRVRVTGFPLERLQQWKEDISAVTREEVAEALKTMLTSAPSATTVLMPEGDAK